MVQYGKKMGRRQGGAVVSSEPKRYEPSTQCVEPSYQAQMIEPIVREVAWGNYVRYEDYANLKSEVERLSQPAVIGGYNLSQYIRMANSETLEFDNGDIFADMTLPERIKYIVESHASLKAEVERLKEDNRQLTKAFEIAEGIIKRMGKAAEDAAKEGKQP